MSCQTPIAYGPCAHTVVYRLLLLYLALVAVEYLPQAVAHLGHDRLARIVELGQLIGLLHQGIQRSDLEIGNRERGRVPHVIGYGGAQRREGVLGVVRGRDGRRQRHQQVLAPLGHCCGALFWGDRDAI